MKRYENSGFLPLGWGVVDAPSGYCRILFRVDRKMECETDSILVQHQLYFCTGLFGCKRSLAGGLDSNLHSNPYQWPWALWRDGKNKMTGISSWNEFQIWGKEFRGNILDGCINVELQCAGYWPVMFKAKSKLNPFSEGCTQQCTALSSHKFITVWWSVTVMLIIMLITIMVTHLMWDWLTVLGQADVKLQNQLFCFKL